MKTTKGKGLTEAEISRIKNDMDRLFGPLGFKNVEKKENTKKSFFKL